MTTGSGAQSAPSGFFGASASEGFSAGTCIVNASILPSGDHATSDGGSTRPVTTAVSPVSSQRTNSCVLPLPSSATYASRSPDGEKRGDE